MHTRVLCRGRVLCWFTRCSLWLWWMADAASNTVTAKKNSKVVLRLEIWTLDAMDDAVTSAFVRWAKSFIHRANGGPIQASIIIAAWFKRRRWHTAPIRSLCICFIRLLCRVLNENDELSIWIEIHLYLVRNVCILQPLQRDSVCVCATCSCCCCGWVEHLQVYRYCIRMVLPIIIYKHFCGVR